jgi:hypothetical protein
MAVARDDGERPPSARWRAVLKRIASGPQLGFICLAIAPVANALWWAIEYGHLDWNILDYAVVVAAAALNASTWLAAILFGKTRQLRASWFALLIWLVALCAAAAVWRPDSANDSLIIVMATLIVLGFPSSMLFKIAAGKGLLLGVALLGMLASAYLQPFVLLPLLFRWRLGETKAAEE